MRESALRHGIAIVLLVAAAGCGEPEPPACVAVCDGLACGPDPVCGAECGACADGFACGAGACADVDECAAGVGGQPACGANTSCANDVGGFACACLPTYAGDPRAAAGCAPTFALDGVAGGGAWYGLRQLRAAYAGPALTAALVGGATRDIGFVDARLDVDALDAFAAGGEVRVSALADQAGARRDARQGDVTRAPILTAVGDRRALAFAHTHALVAPAALDVFDRATQFTLFAPVAWSGTASADRGHVLTVGRGAPDTGDWPFALVLGATTSDATAGRPQAQVQTTAGEYRVDAEGTVGRAGAFELHEVVFDADAGLAYYDSGRLVGQAAFTSGAPLVSVGALAADRVVTLGNDGSHTRGFDGLAYPPVIFDRALPAGERATVREALAAYYGVELPAPRPPAGDEYTIVLVPDTQRFAEQTGGLQSSVITHLVEWVVANRTTWNVQALAQVGDIVNNTQAVQYERALAWYQLLDGAGLPYAVAIGNHDYANVAARDSSLYNSYFSQAHYTARPWWNGGFFEANRTDNLWFTATLGGERVLFVTLEFQPRAEVVAWADALLTAHAGERAILVTHDFMTPTGAFSTARAITGGRVGQELYAELVSRHANVFLVLSGHHARGSAYRHDRATGANYLYFDPMLLDGTSSPATWGNEGYAQLLVISPGKRTIRVMTFSPDRATHRTDVKALFTLDF
jgi:3',5'-cyclic AMP phosphodiesterase CpdA